MGASASVIVVCGAALLVGCNLGLDEDQIQSSGGAGGTMTVGPTTGPGPTGSGPSTTSGMTASSATTGAGTTSASTTGATTTAASSSSTGMMPTVQCTDGFMTAIVDCDPGDVCCVDPFSFFGQCASVCNNQDLTFACDGPEDCPGGECCAPNDDQGDVLCLPSCPDTHTICNSDLQCNTNCGDEFTGPLGAAYQTCN